MGGQGRGVEAEILRDLFLLTNKPMFFVANVKEEQLASADEDPLVSQARAVAEAERFMAIPGQALAYKVGQLKIREIRDNAEARLGDRFDVRKFHTEVLRDGAMPLSILEAKIERWVEAQI